MRDTCQYDEKEGQARAYVRAGEDPAKGPSGQFELAGATDGAASLGIRQFVTFRGFPKHCGYDHQGQPVDQPG